MVIMFCCRLKMSLLLLATVWTTLAIIADGQTYVVTVRSNPDTNDVPMLTNVTLSCRIQPLPSTYHYYEWTSGSNGFYSSRYANLSTIDIPWFRPENDGDYKCTVYLGNGSPLQSNSKSLRAQGNALAISYPYFHKIDTGAEVKMRGRVSVYCYYSGTPQSPVGWRYSNGTKVPPSPLPFELRSEHNEPKKEYILSTNQHPFSLLNKGRYICDLGSTQNNLDVSLSPRSDAVSYTHLTLPTKA